LSASAKRGRPCEKGKLVIVIVLVITIIAIISIIIDVIFMDVVLILRRGRALAMMARRSLICKYSTSLIIKLHRVMGRHILWQRRRHNTSSLLHVIETLLHVMLSLSTSTTLSKDVVHEKLELAGLLALAKEEEVSGLALVEREGVAKGEAPP
jgi:hypothetical protein